MQMAALVLKVVYFPGHHLLDFGGALSGAFQQLFQAPYDARFRSMAQAVQ
jgi:hypothetical protein